MKEKIWFYFENTKNFDDAYGLYVIDKTNFVPHIFLIEEAIKSFNSKHTWEEMWTVSQAAERVDNGHKLFIGADKDGVMTFLWNIGNYVYNLFIDPKAIIKNPNVDKNYNVDFFKAVCNHIDYEIVTAYSDSWNYKAHHYARKAGFKDLK